MFEKYQFHSVHIAIQAVLTLYAQGKVAAYFQLYSELICSLAN